MRQAVRSREERTTTSVTLCHFGEKTEDIDDGKNDEEQKDGQQKNTDGVKTVTARYHYESFEVQLKAHCVNQNVRSSVVLFDLVSSRKKNNHFVTNIY